MRVTGSLVQGSRVRPFVFDSVTGALQLDRHAPRKAGSPPGQLDAQAMAQVVAAAGPVDAVRVNEYFCDRCETWFDASTEKWSVAMCLYCSLDRDSDRD